MPSYRYNNQTHHVHLTHNADGSLTATVDDQTYTLHVESTSDGGLLLDWGDGRAIAHIAKEGDQRYVHINGQSYLLTVPQPRRKQSSNDSDLTAQMPSQVVDVLVAVDDMVKSGQTLMILEAMKMEIRVNAPTDGRIKQILVHKGDIVERGQRLVEFVTADKQE